MAGDPREAALLDRVRLFAQEVVAPGARDWERERRIDRDALKRAAELGLMAIEVPSEHGGLGMRFSCKAQMTRRLAAADFGFAMSVVNSHNIAAKLPALASSTLTQRYLPGIMSGELIGCTALTEPHAGSDFAAIATSAARTSAGWVLDGHKAWIVNAAIADVMMVYAQTEPGSGARGIAAFLVTAGREGFRREAPYTLAGQHTIGTGGFVLERYEVEEQAMLSPPGEAFRQALVGINGARCYVGAMCCGMVEAALEIAADYGRRRTTFGEPLTAHQGWRWALADAATDLAAADALVETAARTIDAREDAQLVAAKAKVFATRMAERHLPILLQRMGAEGLRDNYPLGRHLLGARVAGFVDGTTEILLERVARGYAR